MSIEAFLRGFMKKADAPNPAKGPVPQAKGEPAKADPEEASERPMKEAQKEAILKILKDRKFIKHKEK